MARFQVLRKLAFLPLTATTNRSSLTTAATPRRHILQFASLSILSVASSFRPTITTTSAVAAAPPATRHKMTFTTKEHDLGFLDAASAAALDEELMTQPGFTLEQLMELAGLSVAEAAYIMLSELPPASWNDSEVVHKILIVCGPGNNGGDGLVAARHLHHFGYDTVVVYPKRSSRQAHYANLVQQCTDLNIPVLDEMPSDLSGYALMVDSIFGFSFKGEPREPFRSILQTMQAWQADTKPGLVLSVDVPSGWDVNQGDVTQSGFYPSAVISLTTPKECMRTYDGRHFVGGRFLPPALAEKYQVRMPPYPGVAQVLQVSRGGGCSATTMTTTTTTTTTVQATPLHDNKETDNEAWRVGYAAYCAEKEAQLEAQDGAKEEAYTKESSSSSWEAQYAAYCAEKEAKLAAQDLAEESPSWEAQYAAHCAEKEAQLKEQDKNTL